MRLIASDASPFVRKVRVVLLETGQMDDVQIVPVATSPLAIADEAKVNPVGKIPCLVRPDGGPLYDSRVICRFLDDRAGAGLYPDPLLWDVLTLEATGDAILDAAALMVYEGRCRPEERQHPEWVEGQWTKVAGALDALESRWLDHLAGPLDMGQVAIGCALGYLDFRHGARNWRDGHDGLAAWFADFAQRPSMQATVPG